MKPSLLVKQLRERNIENGVTYVYECDVTQIHVIKKRIDSVETTKGQFRGKQFLIATGAWSPLLAKQIGVSIPVIPGKSNLYIFVNVIFFIFVLI